MKNITTNMCSTLPARTFDEINETLQRNSKVSIIFLLCDDSHCGLLSIKSESEPISSDKKQSFLEFLYDSMNRLGDLFVLKFIECLTLTQNFRTGRIIGLTKSEMLDKKYTGHLSKVKVKLYSIAESLTALQTAELVKSITGNEWESNKLLEEQLLECDINGLLSINTDCVPLKLSTAAHALLPENSIWQETKDVPLVGEYMNIECNSEFYSVIDPANIGFCLIINQEKFTRSDVLPHLLPETVLPPRRGSQKDVEALREVFTWLGFKVRAYNNVTLNKLRTLLSEYAAAVNLNHSFFTLAVMSHGTENVVYTSDSIPVDVEALELAFQRKHCPRLAGKPKIILIQACQGENSQRVMTDDVKPDIVNSSPIAGPERGDALIAWSTVKGFASFRDRFEGSWFVQAFCQELKQSAASRDLIDIVTRVNSALRTKTNHGLYMVPSLSSSLCKKIKFPVTKPFSET